MQIPGTTATNIGKIQLVDEVGVLIGDLDIQKKFSPFPSALLSSEPSLFREHLRTRSSHISSAISQLFSNTSSSSPEISALQSRISKLLVEEKERIIAVETTRVEKEKLEERLEEFALRYMKAEKKLDRSKSTTLAKLEKQAVSGGRNETGSGLGGNIDELGGASGQPNGATALADVDAARRETLAESHKQKEQIMELESENRKLTSQLTDLHIRLSRLSEDDYSKSDLFKQLKSQHEDVIKRINDLEATNIQLQEEAQKLQNERTLYKIEVDKECQAATAEKEALLAQAENDLARVRTARDEYMADISLRKATQSQERASIEQVREMANAKDDRIKALEAEVGRLMQQNDHASESAESKEMPNGNPTGDFQSRYTNLEKQYSLLNTELASMSAAYKKSASIASQKVANLAAMEDKIHRLSAEKVKADQKYFATMKVKEAREQEVRTLRAQNSKSSEMVSSLKDSESASRALQVNLEKQIVEAKESINTLTVKLRTANQLLTDSRNLAEGLKVQTEELKKNLTSKDEIAATKSTAHRAADVEMEKLKIRLEETKKQLESWKSRSQGTSSEEYEMYRSLAICNVCRTNFKNTTMKTCGHVFCEKCVEDRTTLRSRKCPNCNKAFGLGDVMRITL